MVSDNKTTVETKNLPVESYVDGVDEYQDTTVRKVITKGDLWRCAFRGLFMEGNFNFERMQGGGFAFSIIPALRKIHGSMRVQNYLLSYLVLPLPWKKTKRNLLRSTS